MALSFAFGGDTKETPESIKRKRALANALLRQNSAPRNVGEGLTAIGDALAFRALDSQASRGEEAGLAEANKAFGGIDWGSILGTPQNQTSTTSAPAPSATGVDVADRLAKDFGLSPEAAAGIAGNLAHESGDFKTLQERNPVVPGSRGGFGWAQWTGPRRRAFENYAQENGLDPTSPEANYGFLKHELTQTPESSVLSALQGVKDPGQAAQIFSEKFLRPGIPHMDSRVSRATAIAQALAGRQQQPAQVASLDPSVGMETLPGAAQGIGGVAHEQVPPVLTTEQAQAAQQPAPVAAALAGPQQPQAPQQAPTAPSGVSQALLAKNDQALGGIMAPSGTPQPVNAALGGYFPEAPSPDRAPIPEQQFPAAPQMPQGGNQVQQLVKVMSSPFATDEQKAMAGMALKQLQAQNDPANRLDMEYKRAQLEALKNKPERKTAVVNGRLVDTQTGEEIANYPDEPRLPAAVQEYEYARDQGFKGTFQDWEASKKGGMRIDVDPETGAVTFQQGSNIKPLTEGQSKDATFVTRAKGALPNLDKYADSLTKFGANIAANTPVFGNYMKTPEYQQAEQAGKEFLQAILRKDTGAAITKEETGEYGVVYLPQPGDSAEVLTQKKASRDRAVKAIEAGMTPQAILQSEMALKRASALPEGVTEDDITETMRANGMTREQVLEKLNGRP